MSQSDSSSIAPLETGVRAWPGRLLALHPLVWGMAALFVVLQVMQSLADAGLASEAFDDWHLTKRFAFWDILFERAMSGGRIGLQLVTSTVTYAFLHGDWLHVTLNTAAFVALGHAVTKAIGAHRMLASFALTGMAGAVAFGLLTDMPNPLVGASGAIFGFLGMVTAWQERALAHSGASRMSIWQRIVGLAAINAAIVIGLGPLFAWQAHLGGFVAGWLLALLWRPARPAPPS